MTYPRHLGPFLLGLATATALAILAGPKDARAQSRIETTITPPPRAQPSAPIQPAVRPGQSLRPTVDEGERQAARTSGRSAAPQAETEDDEDLIPSAQPGETTVPDSGAANTPTVAARGEARQPSQPPGPVDGLVSAVDDDAIIDGLDPAQVDQRSEDDAAAFATPPEGLDLEAFALEVEPILDRRPRTLFRFEPFAPRGIRAGSFVVLPEVELGGLWSSNVLRSSANTRSDVAFVTVPSVRIVSDWRRHAVELRARGNVSAFADLSSENDRAYALEARGRLDITRRATLEGLVSRDVTQESRSSVDAAQSLGSRTDVTTDTAALAYTQRFNRLTLQLRGAIIDRTFADASDPIAGALSNSSRNYVTTEETLRATWEFKPTLFAFVEAGLNQRDYGAVSSSDGILRNSTGDRYRIGFGFGNTSQRLRGEVSVGYGTQRPNDRRLGDIAGFLVDANLVYRFSGLTSFLVTARTDVVETTLANSAGALSHTFGAEVRHAFRRDLIATASLGHTILDYSGIRLVDRETSTGLGLEYFQSERIVWFGGWRHVALGTTDVSRNFTADELRLGVRLRQ